MRRILCLFFLVLLLVSGCSHPTKPDYDFLLMVKNQSYFTFETWMGIYWQKHFNGNKFADGEFIGWATYSGNELPDKGWDDVNDGEQLDRTKDAYFYAIWDTINVADTLVNTEEMSGDTLKWLIKVVK